MISLVARFARRVSLLTAFGIAFPGNLVMSQWVPQSKGRPTEKVVVEYEKFVEQGSFLSSHGWKTASKIYLETYPYPPDGTIQVVTTGGLVGEDSNRNNRAEVELKWTDHLGTVDSKLRFKKPDYGCVATIYQFGLVYTDKHREISPDGNVVESTGPWSWKIETPLKDRPATVAQAIIYVEVMRDKSKDPVIKKNANQTIKMLKLFTLPSASAC
jgi:hypothetical protein